MQINNLTEKERGYLFGLFEGDGYKHYHKKSRHYTIEFYLNSEKDVDIIAFFISILKKIEFNPNVYQDKRFNCKRIRVYSKELFEYINKNIKLDERNTEFNLGFVSGIIDSEGYVNNKKYTIMIINTNNKMLEECKKTLSSMGITSSLSQKKPSSRDKLPSYRMYVSINFKQLKHNSIKVSRT